MRIAPIAEIKAKFSAYLEESQRGPVVVTKNGKPIAAILAVTDERQLMRLMLEHGPKFQVDLGHILESQGLLVALELLRKEIATTNSVSIHLEIDKSAEQHLSLAAQEVVLSIIVEAVVNAAKHARADNLYLRLIQQPQHIIAEIEDDGAGFDVSKVEAAYPEARRYMDLRAELVKGKTTLQSTPGKGTTVTLTIPIEAV